MPVRRQPAEAPEGLNDDADDPDFLAVRAICEQHAGRLRLLEDRGGFSAVVELPVGVGRGPAAQDAGSAAPPMPAPPGAASRVMVVDDDPAVRRFLERAVRLSGLDVVGTSSTAEAIELAADGSIGLVLCDQRLAGTTGVETYEALIAHRPDLAERFVLTTGDIDSDEVRRFSASTGAAILAKPFDLAAIGRLLARYRSE
jgi:CheY-like chemotaxis protein